MFECRWKNVSGEKLNNGKEGMFSESRCQGYKQSQGDASERSQTLSVLLSVAAMGDLMAGATKIFDSSLKGTQPLQKLNLIKF